MILKRKGGRKEKCADESPLHFEGSFLSLQGDKLPIEQQIYTIVFMTTLKGNKMQMRWNNLWRQLETYRIMYANIMLGNKKSFCK